MYWWGCQYFKEIVQIKYLLNEIISLNNNHLFAYIYGGVKQIFNYNSNNNTINKT